MTQATAQIFLSLLFLGAALAFVLVNEDEIAIALVGAVLGQGVSISITTAVNGKEAK
jgi:hypothetical protein